MKQSKPDYFFWILVVLALVGFIVASFQSLQRSEGVKNVYSAVHRV